MIANSFTVHSHPPGVVAFLDELKANNVGIMNAAVFNGGFLIGSDFYNYHRIDPDSPRGRELSSWRDTFQSICDDFGISVAEACVRFGNSHPAVNTVALSSSRPQRVATNVASVSREVPDGFWEAVREHGLIDSTYPHLA